MIYWGGDDLEWRLSVRLHFESPSFPFVPSTQRYYLFTIPSFFHDPPVLSLFSPLFSFLFVPSSTQRSHLFTFPAPLHDRPIPLISSLPFILSFHLFMTLLPIHSFPLPFSFSSHPLHYYCLLLPFTTLWPIIPSFIYILSSTILCQSYTLSLQKMKCKEIEKYQHRWNMWEEKDCLKEKEWI